MIRRISRFLAEAYKKSSIQSTIFLSFTISTIVVVSLIALSFYNRFSSQLDKNIQEEKQILIEQVNQTLDSYLRNMMKLSDSLYYNVMKNADIEDDSVSEKMQLLYEVNKDYIVNIAVFDEQGQLLAGAPPAKLKEDVDVTHKEWFINSREKTENLHFSLPAVQNIFMDAEYQYQWIITLSRSAEITKGKEIQQGILLIDMKYSGIEQIFKNARLGNSGYIYLADAQGEIIYHPKQQLIASGEFAENNQTESALRDGNYELKFDGEQRIVTVKSVGYTGWKIIGVTKQQSISLNSQQNRFFLLFIFVFFVLLLSVMNSYISTKITTPIKRLEKTVMNIEREMDEEIIFVGGSYEMQQLGKTIKKMVRQMRGLMDDVVREHEAKRKSELNALQAQINPHFLYNTLDIIVWMVENERPLEAVRAVTALARLFRISLSRGKTLITVEDELEHIRNYLTIQEMRYKNRFVYKIEVEEGVSALAILKLIIQPIVENAIYHGMEFMDGDGEIYIHAYREGEGLFILIRDNGFGMTPETVAALLSGKAESKKGSGIGISNIQERIRIYFGPEYGIKIESEPDEGTTVILCLPALTMEEAREKEVT